MKVGTVVVQGDYLQKITTTRNPLRAIEEIIWNGFDADADVVSVEFEKGSLVKLGVIRVIDNGEGIPLSEAEKLFERLGGSWKAKQEKTPKGRFIHGKNGEGRFKAFSLGNSVTWETTYRDGNNNFTYTISALASDLRRFTISDPAPTTQGTGTVCTITDIYKDYRVWGTEEVIDDITERFAPYLYDNRQIKLVFDGNPVDPAAVIQRHKTIQIVCTSSIGTDLAASLTVIEWSTKAKRSLYICNSKNFPLHKQQPGIRARGFHFTAYLASTYFDNFSDDNNDALLTLDVDATRLIEAAKDKLRDYFREREAEIARTRVDEWITQEIYPFQGEASDPLARSERQIFDVLAVNLADYSKAFEESAPEAKKVTFGLLRAALETGPSAVQRVFKELLELPEDLQEDLSELMEKVSLTGMIVAAREIVDRLDFMAALRLLVFNPVSKKQLLERSQLHKILEQRTWLFGEEFNLSASDQGLTAVLDKHLKLLRREPSITPVLREDGSTGIVDLMLSRLIPHNRGDWREHLVIELKRPKQPITHEIAGQVMSYARAVIQDEQFDDKKTVWNFWALSNEIDPAVLAQANQANRAPGLYYEDRNPEVRVWIKTWAQVIQECEGRHKFVRERLDYSATDKSALEHLQKMHNKYLPPAFIKEREIPEGADAHVN